MAMERMLQDGWSWRGGGCWQGRVRIWDAQLGDPRWASPWGQFEAGETEQVHVWIRMSQPS